MTGSFRIPSCSAANVARPRAHLFVCFSVAVVAGCAEDPGAGDPPPADADAAVEDAHNDRARASDGTSFLDAASNDAFETDAARGGQPDASDAGSVEAAVDSRTATGTDGEAVVNGRTAPGAPDDGAVFAAWIVSAGGPDYTFVYGHGDVSDDQFHLAFPGALPTDARNFDSMGVAIILHVPVGQAPLTGRVEEDFWDGLTDVYGVSRSVTVIFRAEAVDERYPDDHWIRAFPAGYSCGRCVETEGTFDAFVPADCEGAALEPLGRICNWT